MKKFLILCSILSLFGCANSIKPEKSTTPIKLTSEQQTTKYNNEFTKNDLPVVKIEKPENTAGQNGELQDWVVIGNSAPYSGVLLNPEAMAYVISQNEAGEERSKVTVEKQRDLDLAKLNLETAKLQVERDTIERKNQVIVAGRDDELKRSQELNQRLMNDEKKPWKKILIGIGSAAVGVGAGILIGGISTN